MASAIAAEAAPHTSRGTPGAFAGGDFPGLALLPVLPVLRGSNTSSTSRRG